MKRGFVPISLKRYVKLHTRANPDTDREDLVHRLRAAMDADARGVLCRCGNRIWIIGSAEVGLSCFTCITGEPIPDNDYEIIVDRAVTADSERDGGTSEIS
jgi:hypothetical protein